MILAAIISNTNLIIINQYYIILFPSFKKIVNILLNIQ